jgi:hypothetical protein
MLELPHTAVGAVIGSRIPDPWIALPLALASHFLLDLIPHWNPDLYLEKKKDGRVARESLYLIIADVLASLILGSTVAWHFWPDVKRISLIYLTCLFTVLPDVDESLYFFSGINHPFLLRLVKFQRRHQGRTGKKLGLAIQLAVVLISLFYLFS